MLLRSMQVPLFGLPPTRTGSSAETTRVLHVSILWCDGHTRTWSWQAQHLSWEKGLLLLMIQGMH